MKAIGRFAYNLVWAAITGVATAVVFAPETRVLGFWVQFLIGSLSFLLLLGAVTFIPAAYDRYVFWRVDRQNRRSAR